ncbi:fused MFS/spermidine synthase [Modestobacter sp. VKM Ac-2983]|uniref:spermidine synthase n=1 Tax=Modestobacter sp. VKM Ac-2983 TaxID=3004137 RepID=UPI0022AB949F|nr:fused MFS/spermidine synthase [Modestobacter sp. VKM Ac-2983]MCZ2806221.1 fused MFS/spermidine synthase [Modestobacter sp. VKM Ac-2983]
MGRRDRGHLRALPGATEVGGGTAELLADADRDGAWQLLVNGTPQSHVDLTDPTYLEFEYVRRMGHVLDLVADPDRPLDVVHLGGGALTLPRYVAATRPGSAQRVMELDEALTELVRRELPLPRNARVRVRGIDARAGLAALPDASADVVLVDVFAGARTPAHLTTVEFATDVARVLRPGGTTAWNVSDGPPLRFARAEAATLRAVFGHVALLAEPGTLRGRRFGNTVAVASAAELPIAGLTRRCAGDPMPSRVVSGAELDRFVGQAVPVTDAVAEPSPPPPAGVFG